MDKVLILIKLISLLYPKKSWDTNSHFIFTHQDRQLMKEYLKSAKKMGFHKMLRKVNLIDHDFLSYEKGEVYHLYIGPKYIWDHDYKMLWKPHEDKGIWKVEEVFNEKISHVPKVLGQKILGNYSSKGKK